MIGLDLGRALGQSTPQISQSYILNIAYREVSRFFGRVDGDAVIDGFAE